MFEVILSPEAQAFFAAADKPFATKLARCFKHLEIDPRRHNNIKRLSGKLAGKSRFRVGEWRGVVSIEGDGGRVVGLEICPRRQNFEVKLLLPLLFFLGAIFRAVFHLSLKIETRSVG